MNLPRVILRRNNLVDLSIRRAENISRYRFRGHNNLDSSFLVPAPMFEVDSGLHYRSKSIREYGLGYVEDAKRGLTKATFNPDDFVNGPIFPFGNNTLFLRMEEFNTTLGMYGPPGPVIVIPPEDVWLRTKLSFVLYGTAYPSATATAGLPPPNDILCINMSLYNQAMFMKNLDPATNMLFSTSPGGPMGVVPFGDEIMVEESGSNLLYLCSDGAAAVNFSIIFSCMGA